MNSFLQGQSAMYCDSISIFGPARDPKKSKVTETVGYVVHPKATKYSGELGGFGLAIPKNSARRDAAFAFIQWMTAAQQDVQVTSQGGQPTRWSTSRSSGRQENLSGGRLSRMSQDREPGLAADHQ